MTRPQGPARRVHRSHQTVRGGWGAYKCSSAPRGGRGSWGWCSLGARRSCKSFLHPELPQTPRGKCYHYSHLVLQENEIGRRLPRV